MTHSVRILGNNRIATRGLTREGRGVCLKMDSDETVPINIDWSSFLGADTIASVTNSATSATLAGESNTATTASLSVSANGSAIIEHRITTAAGTIKELPIYVNGAGGFHGGGKYYDC